MANSAVQAKPSKSLFSFFGSGRAIWFVAVGFAVAALFGVMTLLSSATATTTYYVLGAPVAARTQITPEMLLPVTTSDGGQPGNAYDAIYVRDHQVFAKMSLQRGDVISSSNAGPATRLTTGLPDNFVAASFTVTADNAVGGKVRAGDFIDVIAQNESDGNNGSRIAKMVLNRVYVLDVSVAAETLAEGTDASIGKDETAEGEVAEESPLQGVPALYTVALSPEDAVKVAQIRDKNIFLVLSALKPVSSLDVQQDLADIFAEGAVKDSSEGIVLGGAKAKKSTTPATPTTPTTPVPSANATAGQ